ncbi:MAG: biotin transporter BioY [Treponemataceae bacterium]
MKNQKKTIVIALFSALISAGSFILIPLPTGIPIVVQDMFAVITGLLLGPTLGGLSVALFLLLGIIGFPVFSGKAGISVIIAGPTGGFLAGYLVAAIAGGLFLRFFLREKLNSQASQWIIISIAVILSNAIIFICGTLAFMHIGGKSFLVSLSLVVLPYLFGNAIKIIVAIFVVKRFRPIIKNYL